MSGTDSNEDDQTVVVAQGAPKPQIPGYRTLKSIGEGGMATVFLAEDEHLKKKVAIKIVHTELATDAGFVDRFRDECAVAANLTHPNIVIVHSAGTHEGDLYMVMEHLDGDTLEDRMQSEDWPSEGPFRTLAHGIAAALAHVHANNAVHRDLKPSNVMFRKDGTPVLTDFGIAKSEVFDSHKTQTGYAALSYRYASPEQLRGGAAVDRSDVYSYGLLLCEALTGRLPGDTMPGSGEVATAESLLAGLPEWVSRLQPLIERCLSTDAADRPSAQEIVDWFESTSTPEPQKRRLPVLAISVVLLSIATAAYFWLPDTDPPAQVAQPAAALYPDRAEFRYFDDLFSRSKDPQFMRAEEFSYEPFSTLIQWLAADLAGEPTTTWNTANRQAVDREEASARFVRFMATQQQLTDDTPAAAEQLLLQASEAGHALSTYVRALLVLAAAGDEGNTRAEIETHLALLERAREQGLSWVGPEVERARALLNSPG